MELWGSLLEEQQSLLKSGISRECFVSSYLQSRTSAGLEDAPGRGVTEDGWMRDELVAYTAATILEAGSDTTASALHCFVLFMLSNPGVRQKAREEIDRVVGEEHPPTLEDEPRLPYVVACVKETLRRRSPIIMGNYTLYCGSARHSPQQFIMKVYHIRQTRTMSTKAISYLRVVP